jgi:acetyl esterase/lipase
MRAMRFSTLLLPATLLFTTSTSFADEPPVPAELFFQRPALIDSQLSPTGQRLALRVTNPAGRIVVAMLDLNDGNKLHSASVVDADVTSFDWVSDNRLVLSAQDLNAAGRDRQEFAPGLYAVTADGVRSRNLVRATGTPFVTSGDDGSEKPLDWNHQLLLVPTPQAGVEPDEVVVGRLDFGDRTLDRIVPLWLNTRNGQSRDVEIGHVPDHAVDWWFDSAGHPRALYTRHEGQGAYYWRGPGDKEWRLLAQGPALSMPFSIDSVDDAGQLYVTVARGTGGVDVLTRFDFSKNAPAERALVMVPGFDFRGALLKDAAGTGALGVRVDGDAETTVWFDPAMRAFQAEVDAKLPGRINRIQCRRCGTPDMVATVRSFSARDPGALWLYRAADKHWTRLTPIMKGVEPRRMADVDFQRIKARDGEDLPVWLTMPQGVKPGQPAPTVVMVHGGPWARIGHWRWDAMNQFLASRGYLVIEPEFRGSEGYGDTHFRAGFKQWGQAMEDDLVDALHWAEDQGLAVKGRACIAGASYGGYAALMGPVRAPEAFRCVIAGAAVADLDLFLQGRWWLSDDIGNEGRKFDLPVMVGDTSKDEAMLKANSPVLLADKMHAPVMLVWGDEDLRVPIAHGKRMREALTKAGNPPLWVVYEGEGHGWINPANEIDYARRVEDFLAKYLR